MIKLTRLNRNIVAINPDHISWVDVSPDTTLFLIGGEKIIVLEALDDLIERVIEYRQASRGVGEALTGDAPPAVLEAARRRSPVKQSGRPMGHSYPPRPPSIPPHGGGWQGGPPSTKGA